MKQKTKKIIHIIMTALCGLIGCKYPAIEEAVKEIKEDINELINENEERQIL